VQLLRATTFEATLQQFRSLAADANSFDDDLARALDVVAALPISGDLVVSSQTTVHRATRMSAAPPLYVVHAFEPPDRLLLDLVIEASQVAAYRARIPAHLLDQDRLLMQKQFAPAELRALARRLHATLALPMQQRPQPAATDESLALTLDHIARRRAIAAP
jgi:prophage DNA circulation protein